MTVNISALVPDITEDNDDVKGPWNSASACFVTQTYTIHVNQQSHTKWQVQTPRYRLATGCCWELPIDKWISKKRIPRHLLVVAWEIHQYQYLPGWGDHMTSILLSPQHLDSERNWTNQDAWLLAVNNLFCSGDPKRVANLNAQYLLAACSCSLLMWASISQRPWSWKFCHTPNGDQFSIFPLLHRTCLPCSIQSTWTSMKTCLTQKG